MSVSNAISQWNTTVVTTETDIDDRYPFSDEVAIIVTVILLLLMVFTIVANTITIIVIIKSSKLTSVFSKFIVSLCFSDLGSALVSPIFIYRRTIGFRDWMIPAFLCNFSWCIHMWTNYVTSIHIVCFAALRLWAVAKPIKFKRIKKVHALISIVLIWIICFLAGGLPFLILYGVREPGTIHKSPACSAQESKKDMFRMYTNIAYPIFFYLPVLLVTALSLAILIKYMRRRKTMQDHASNPRSSPTKTISSEVEMMQNRKKQKTKNKEAQERSAILQLVLIVFSFFVGYLPFTIYQLISYAKQQPPVITYQIRADDWTFGIIEYILLRLSECLNPVFYNLASLTMRTETFALLQNMCSCLSKKSSSSTDQRDFCKKSNSQYAASAL